METPKEKPEKLRVVGKAKPERVAKHSRAMIDSLKKHPGIQGSMAESLLGLARAWDHIEATGRGINAVPSIAREIRATWEQIGVLENDEDIWESIS